MGHRPQPADHGGRVPPWFTLGLAAIAASIHFVSGSWADWLIWDRAALSQGQFWRHLTGHFVHTDLEHFVWNVAALIMLGGLLESFFRIGRERLAILFTLSALAVSGAVWVWRSDLGYYAGLSGILNAYFVVLLYVIWQRYRHVATIFAAIGLIAKTVAELLTGASLMGVGAWPTVVEAHTAGAAVGLVMVVVLKFNELRLCFR